jgi:hypothetical protein
MKKNFESSPNYTMAKKLPRPTAVMDNPGPGRYENQNSKAVQKRLPCWAFGTEVRSMRRRKISSRHEITAGPGSFDPYKRSELKNLLGKFSQSVKQVSSENGTENGVPSSWDYTPKKTRSKNPESWVIKGKVSRKEGMGPGQIHSPHPNTYTPNLNLTQLASTNWSFGRQQARADTMVNRTVCHGDVAQILTINKSFDHKGVDPTHYSPAKPRKMIRHVPFHKDSRKTVQDRTGTNEIVGPGTYDH